MTGYNINNNSSNNNANRPLGAVPKSRPKQAPQCRFTTQNYSFANGDLISLPVRPANLSKRDGDRFRDIIKQIAIDLDQGNDRFFIAYRRSVNGQTKNNQPNTTQPNNTQPKNIQSNNTQPNTIPDEWWQSGGNSVLFYHHRLEKQFALYPINLRPDNDFGCTWPANTYVIMIKNIKRMVAQLQAKAKATIILDTPELIVLQFPTEFSADDIKAFRHINSGKREYVNKLLLPKVVNPHTYRSIIELYRAIVNHVNNLSESQRCIFGYQAAQYIQDVTFNFVAMSNGRIPPREYYGDALTKIACLCDWLVTIQNFKIFTVDELYDIANLAEQVRKNIQSELQQLQSKSDK